MTTPGSEPAESEFSFGPGMVPHPDRSVRRDDVPVPLPPTGGTRRDQLAQLWAERRTDSTNPNSSADLFVYGNPDRFGGQPPLVRESATLPQSTFDPNAPGGVKGATYEGGVVREP